MGRVLKRAEIEGRSDDTEKAIRERIRVYEEQTAPLLDHYQVQGLVVEVDGAARQWLLEQADTDPSTGARPLRRTIQRHLQDSVSDILIQQLDEPIGLIEVTMGSEGLRLTPRAGAPISTEN